MAYLSFAPASLQIKKATVVERIFVLAHPFRLPQPHTS